MWLCVEQYPDWYFGIDTWYFEIDTCAYILPRLFNNANYKIKLDNDGDPSREEERGSF